VEPRDLDPILQATLRESTMPMLVIGMSLLSVDVTRHLHVSQSSAQWTCVAATVTPGGARRHSRRRPPAGLDLFVIDSIAPDLPLPEVVRGVWPFVVPMIFAVILLCSEPEIATWLADTAMGPTGPGR
jgi:hypothetical protein